MREHQVACILIVLMGAGAAAGEEKASRLDLQTSVARALTKHPDLGTAQAGVQMSEADLQKAHAGYFPTGELIDAFGLAPGAKLGVVPPGLPQNESLAAVLSPSSQFDFSNIVGFNRMELEIRQPLYTFGKLKTGTEAARMGAVARKAELARTREDVVLEVKRTWWGHKLARESLDLTNELVKAFEEALEKAEERLQKGEPGVTQPDVLKLKIALAETQKNQARLVKEVGISLAGYRRALGYLPNDPVFPDEEKLKPVEAPKLDDLPPLDEVTRARPAWQAAEAGVLAQEKKVRVERLKYYPDFFVAGLFRWAVAPGRPDINNPFLVDEFNFIVGGAYLGLRLNVDPWGTSAKVAEEQARLAELRAKWDSARVGLPVEASQAYLGLRAAQRTLEVMQGARKAGRALAMTTLANFSLGIGDADDVLEAVGFYGRADAGWLESIYDFNLAVAELSRVLGRELDPALAEADR